MTGYNDFGGSNSCVALGIRGNGYSALRHRGLLDNGKSQHIAFGGLRVDDAIEAALLQLVGPAAIIAAISTEAEALGSLELVDTFAKLRRERKGVE